jgi:hypothetical protein
MSRCRTEIDRQIEVWNCLTRNTAKRLYDDVIEKIISIISIPASEASCCCERTFSRHKRICGSDRQIANGHRFTCSREDRKTVLRLYFSPSDGRRAHSELLCGGGVRHEINRADGCFGTRRTVSETVRRRTNTS